MGGGVAQHHLAGGVQRQRARGQHYGGALGGSGAADQRPQPRHQHDERERFGQVVIGAEIERVGLVVIAVLGGQHQHRGGPHLAGPQLPQHLVAAHRGQHDVEHDDVEVVLDRLPQPVDAVVETTTTKFSARSPASSVAAKRGSSSTIRTLMSGS